LTASEGPGPATLTVAGTERQFFDYVARGVPHGPDDGTIAPWAVAASLPFAPEIVLPALDYCVHELKLTESNRHGFKASFNPTFPAASGNHLGWISPWHFGLNEGPTILMVENYRTGLLWRLMRNCPYVVTGLRRAGFAGGWLESEHEPQCPQAVEGQWRERGTPFSKLSKSATHGERAQEHSTANMLAARIHSYGDPTGVKIEQAPRPEPGRGQVLVRVKAAGVNPLDWMIAEGKARSWLDHRLPLILGWELAGTVERLGADVKRLKLGDEVFGMIDLSGDGADAEFAVGSEKAFAIKPRTLDSPTAAAVPVCALTAHQALFDAAELRAGQTILIHAAAGGVGSMAVQLAKTHGAKVIGTASGPEHIKLLRDLGCDQAIDYKTKHFENHVRDVDVVLDPVSADTQRRSFGVLKKGGILVALTEEPAQNLARENGVRATMIGVKPDGRRLADIAKIIDDGKLRPIVQAVLPLAQAREALALSRGRHVAGKIVLTI
jgi:NADPH:quinone reductase-like Zn-dependent oxidoreductase